MPNADVLGPIQRTLYDVLTGDVDLTAVISGVYDHVPEEAAFPYIVIGEATAVSSGALDRWGRRSAVTLHIWSAYHGWAEALTIVDHLVRLLDEQALAVPGHEFVACRHEQTVTLRDPDADLRHVPCRFSIETERPA